MSGFRISRNTSSYENQLVHPLIVWSLEDTPIFLWFLWRAQMKDIGHILHIPCLSWHN